MTASKTISNKPPEQPGMDYAFLREQGIKYLQKLGPRDWTNFNAHDPGITILEILCFAITDLSYRLGFDIADLLSPDVSLPVLDKTVFSFNGIDDYVEVPYSSQNNPDQFTISCWAKVRGKQGIFRSPVTSRSTPANGYMFYAASDNKWKFLIGDGHTWQFVVGPDVALGTWTHLAGVYENGISKFYVDGTLINEKAANFAANPNKPMRIGAGATEKNPQFLFPGEIADVRVWNIARTGEDIRKDMNSRLKGSEPGLSAYWPLTNADNNTAPNMTGKGNHGIVRGAVQIQADPDLPCLSQKIETIQFFRTSEILPVNPLTINDFRKLIIDVQGVKNAWLEKCPETKPELYYDPAREVLSFLELRSAIPITLNGLYVVHVEKEPAITADADLIARIRQVLLQHRNLCEDFEKIQILPIEHIDLTADIELEKESDANAALAEIYVRVKNLVSPAVPFYSFRELLEKGRTVDEIFCGPLLQNGFIDEDDLDRFNRKSELHISDFIHVIMDIPGVKNIRGFGLSSDISTEQQEWALDLDPDHVPRLCDPDFILSQKRVKFSKGNIACRIMEERVRELVADLESKSANRSVGTHDPGVPVGRYRNLADYETIQNEFPVNYGIGQLGLPSTARPERQARAGQLKAFLLFFDRILADYARQLEHAKHLLAVDYEGEKTYFPGALDNILGIKEILKPGAGQDPNACEDEELARRRRSRLLDHLMARFSEKFTDYSLMLHNGLNADYISEKSAFLKDYPHTGALRGKGFNYGSSEIWNTSDVSGLKSRICSKLGISDSGRRNLADGNTEGFHLLEHILLRPQKPGNIVSGDYLDLHSGTGDPDTTSGTSGTISANNTSKALFPQKKEPFSFQITIVFPDWLPRFADPGFKILIHKIIMEETPAHITPTIIWLNKDQMREFETSYQQWLDKKSQDADDIQTYSEKLLVVLNLARKPVDRILRLDGRSACIEMPNTEILNPRKFTISCWIRPTGGPSTWRTVISSRSDAPARGCIITIGQNNLWQFSIGTGGTSRVTLEGPQVRLNTWSHLTATYDGDTMRFYVNHFNYELAGVSLVPTGSDEMPFRIGAGGTNPDSGSSFFPGSIREMRIWGRAFSGEEVLENRQMRLHGDEPDLLAYWPLNEGFGDKVNDLTQNSNHGKNHGGQWLEMTDAIKTPDPGTAMEFDGIDDYIQVEDFEWTQGGPVAAEFWVKTYKKRNQVVFKVGSPDIPNLFYAFLWKNGYTYWDYGTRAKGRLRQYTGNLLNQWMHVALVSGGKTDPFKALYINGGLLQKTGTGSEEPTITLKKLFIGATEKRVSLTLKGQLSDLRIWNVTRSLGEIRKHMFCRLRGDEEGLMGYWPMDEGAGDMVHDRTVNARHGKINSATWVKTTDLNFIDRPRDYDIIGYPGTIHGATWETVDDLPITDL